MNILGSIVGFLRNGIGNHGKNGTLQEFFETIGKNQKALEQTYINILGKERADKVLELDKYLLPPDSYFSKISSLRGYTACGVSGRENMSFYVLISPREGDEFKIGSTGEMEVSSRILRTSPFFFFSPTIMEKHAKELKETSLPPYLALWIHEYSHFIGYCLQKRPIAAAISILYGELLKRGDRDLWVRDLVKLLESKDEMEAEIAKTLIYLQSLDEDMVTFLQELILEDLGFSVGGYFSEPMKNNFFYPHFKKWRKGRFVDYIEDWNNANFMAPEFMKTYLKSFNKIEADKCPKSVLDQKS